MERDLSFMKRAICIALVSFCLVTLATHSSPIHYMIAATTIHIAILVILKIATQKKS